MDEAELNVRNSKGKAHVGVEYDINEVEVSEDNVGTDIGEDGQGNGGGNLGNESDDDVVTTGA